MLHLFNISSLCNLKSSAEALQFQQSGIDMAWGSKPVGFCQKHVYDFLSSLSLPAPPCFAAPWQEKAPKVHQSVLGSKFPCLQKIILVFLFLILWQIRTKHYSDKILCGKALPISTQLYSKAIERTKLTAELLLP